MQKLFFPLILGLLFLSSCSQALYKHKYDWVKVDRSPAPVVNTPAREKIVPPPVSPVQAVAETMEAVFPRDTVATPAVAALHETQEAAREETAGQEVEQGRKANVLRTTEEHRQTVQHAQQHVHAKKQVRKGTFDWGGLCIKLGFILLLVLLIVFSSHPAVQVMLLVLQIIIGILGIVGICLLLYWLFKLFFGFLFMMG